MTILPPGNTDTPPSLLSRRQMLRIGGLGFGSLVLADLMHREGQAAVVPGQPQRFDGPQPGERRADDHDPPE